ncbi:MAG: hypothetical protein RBS34_06965 [Desulfofustis sp.]|nr:hypothetical protein [Desulfofustis sp.]
MSRDRPQKRAGAQRGQAATECVIIASLVLVPLFLLIPLLGKYIDIKQAAIQQARFEAWEYTAWFDHAEVLLSGISSDQRTGRRDFSETRVRGNNLFFSDPAAAAYTSPDSVPLRAFNPLWVDHRGDTLFTGGPSHFADGEFRQRNSPDPTSGLLDGGLVNDLLSLINWVTTLFGKLLHFLWSDAQFDALNTEGYFLSSFNVKVRNSYQVVPDMNRPNVDDQPITIQARASVLARGWNAGSTANASSESKGLVVTALLEPVSKFFNGAVDLLQRGVNRASHVLPISMTLPHGPQFGHVEDDLIPYEHLQGDRRTAKSHEGLFYYAE